MKGQIVAYSTRLGTITIDGETYEHDVVVRLSGEVVKRKKKLSKKIYGTSHTISEDEIRFQSIAKEGGARRRCLGPPPVPKGSVCRTHLARYPLAATYQTFRNQANGARSSQ